jgi:glycerate kinase
MKIVLYRTLGIGGIMKIIAAPDSFKGSMSAVEVCKHIEKGIRLVDDRIEVVKIPMADGGEGTVDALVNSTGGRYITAKVKDPLMRDINASYGILGNGRTAVIEMAAASGITLLAAQERNPLLTNTFGTGQLIKHALEQGCRDIIIGVGGSATNDGGAGMAMALGAKFTDTSGKEIGFGGGALSKLDNIDLSRLDPRIFESRITVACDVDIPLCGEKGASYVFGPQKGADARMVKILDNNLFRFAGIIKKVTGKSIINVKGAGAAGGLAGGIIAFLAAELRSGIDIVIKESKLEEQIAGSDLIITGEGKMDVQTVYGKTPLGVAKAASKNRVPVIAIVGSIGEGTEILYDKGITGIFSIINRPMQLEAAMKDTGELIEEAAQNILRLWRAAKTPVVL